ncbi:phosphodiesterase, MJ0936 family [Thermodesulfatator indicus DSM 15286]|uniref:Phosphoesterase n=1 Tax=Thermodesulfatator indicus (strain DSM 15286 / JCM 11887 / CIR29812) TaxID=667014 RepID=F8A876_THEID|nr:metallophosphoesterase [Thermodesulfatator indicus]AEH44411.1 phosphodiesterase, MJ0936 family [Thermodesulfatator indicus DSM 15286]
MLLAVVSDSHDAIPNLRKAVSLANEKEAEVLIHCGDLISPFMLLELSKFKGEVHFILGNNPGDVWLLMNRLKDFPKINCHGQHAFLNIDGLNIAVVHFPATAEGLAATGKYDVVFYGHSHEYEEQKVGETLLLNPGEILGKDGPPTMILFDTVSKKVEKVTFDEGSC